MEQTGIVQSQKLVARIAERYGIDAEKLMNGLRHTVFKGAASTEQLMALLVVADQYKLNPWTKEIYAFPDGKGVIPVVGVDGWARIVNEHPQFDGVTFTWAGEGDDLSCTCRMYRKDRSHPVEVTEFLVECRRQTGPWKSHTRRMLRHKAFVQAARLGFGFAGIYDADEGDAIRAAKTVQATTLDEIIGDDPVEVVEGVLVE